jgi:hypothetical protein
MVWVVTLRVTDCASSAILAGATINDGVNLFSTDANGQFIAVVDDAFTGYIIQVSKSGYISKTVALSNTQNGTTLPVCLSVSPPTTATGAGPSGGCFIVSAATGSPDSREVQELRGLRDRIAYVSQLGARLIDAIYHDYYQFSPEIASAIEQDPVSREVTLSSVVRPLLGWYALAGALALEHSQTGTVAAVERATIAAKDDAIGGPTVASFVESIRTGQPLPPNMPPRLAAYIPKLQRAASLRFASWAILDPLVRLWRGDLKTEVADWLATAPIEQLSVAMPAGLSGELNALARLFDFNPGARAQLGARLAQAWPEAVELLQQHGFS